MKKIGKILLVIALIITLSACGTKTNSGNNNGNTTKAIMFGDTVTVKGFEIDLVNYSIRDAATETEKYPKLVYLEVNVKNISGKAAVFTNTVWKAYGPDNILLPKLVSDKYPTMLSNMGAIRNKGVTNGHIIIPFVGYGEYYIEFTCPYTTSEGKATNIIRTFKFVVRE